ncbi:MAG: PSD1 and planctomycete cytochrome C domain-containing protein [Planctomycetaceae bacterium]
MNQIILLAGILVSNSADSVFAQDSRPLDYSRDVRPILSDKCFRCHGPDETHREAGLRLDTRDGAIAAISGGRAIVPGNTDDSEVLTRILTDDADLKMPPASTNKSLTKQEIAVLTRWIEQGAGYNDHWAFREVVQPEVPVFDLPLPMVVRNPIDAFVYQELLHHQIQPSPAAEKHTLIRRVYLDVIGLTPSIEDLELFLNDESPDAYRTMVDRALASPHYGERWGRHWLDHARYADTHGYTVDGNRTIWPYRDWVIAAFNNDMPFDQFTIEQIAGDLLPEPTRSQLVATGFHRNTLVNQEGGTDAEQFRNEAVVDRVNTTGAVWLGLTVGCAQCHTHKYDPITQHEYYQLFAFFNQGKDVNSTSPVLSLPTDEQTAELQMLDSEMAEIRKHIAAIDLQLRNGETIEASTRDQLNQDRMVWDEKQKTADAARKKVLSAIPQTMIMGDVDRPRETHVLIRGDFLRHGDVVHADTPRALSGMAPKESPRNRLDLAKWLVSRSNPLTARVTMNRMWARYFGQGLVETENDFGFQGTPPTHPELLDWLAAEFMDAGWSMKHMHRLILNSATYRQSSIARPDLSTVDPLNKLLARQSRLRVDAEVVRDLGLAVSGLLNETIGGPSVFPPQPDGVYAFTQRNAGWPTSKNEDRFRRGMYTFFMRSAPYPMLTTFDTPRFNTTCTMRVRSNTPLQSLTMANDQAMTEMALALSKRIFAAADNDRDRIIRAWRLCFSRTPQPNELKRLQDYALQQRLLMGNGARSVEDPPKNPEEQELRIWFLIARTLMNLDEFIVRE